MENDNNFFLRNHINIETVLLDLHKQILLEIFRRVCKYLSEANNNSDFKELVRSKSTESGTMLVYRNLVSLVTPLQISDDDIYKIREWITAFWEACRRLTGGTSSQEISPDLWRSSGRSVSTTRRISGSMRKDWIRPRL